MAGLNLRTFPLNKPFVDALACAVQSHGADADPLALARALVLLPSRRACVALREAFARLHGGAPHLLPRMQPLADVDEDALFSESWLAESVQDAALELPPPMPRGLRHILLANLIRQNGTVDTEHAALLARELARLMDAMAMSGIGFEGLSGLAPDEMAGHWQKTVDFLEIVRVGWPRILAQEGMMDPIVRRSALLGALALRWETSPPPYPVIAAGSTGSQAATAALLKSIAAMPLGMVVLAGLDKDMDEEAWAALTETHPQWGLKALLDALGVPRADVQLPDDKRVAESSPAARMQLLQLALQPAEFTPAWRDAKPDKAAFEGIERMECASPREEAQAIALRLRAALEVPGARAAVVTQDRNLARMVAASMRQFGVSLDDSAGTPVWRSAPGVFVRLVAEVAASNAAPVPLLALLKHPLCLLGMEAADCRRAARALEVKVLRGVRGRTGLAGLRRAMASRKHEDQHLALAMLDALIDATADFSRALRAGGAEFARLLALHVQAAERIAGEGMLFAQDAGVALADALHELSQHGGRLGAVEARHYPGLLETLATAVVRPAFGTHPRLHILSPIEARLQHFDVVILAGLNEGAWPATPQPSPWMSRPMQRRFGLPQPEEAVGKSAHDFMLLAGAPEVVFSRSRKSEGVAAQPSRWLARLDTLLAAMHGEWHWAESPYAQWARISPDAALPPVSPPAPRPPAFARPASLSVTEIETWQRDPYGIYAKRVLGLKALDALDEEPDMADFGNIVHRALQTFAEAYPDALPENVEAELARCGEEALKALADRPAVAAFWQPRFAAAIPWLAGQERARRPGISRLYAEWKGELALEGLQLTTRIDRLEQHGDGTFSIIDYKTGGVPDKKDVAAAISPQLALEALIAQQALAAGTLQALQYWKLSGERNEVVEAAAGGEATALCSLSLARLRELIAAFSQADMPYLACPDAGIAPRYNDYTHLERREEWEWMA